MNSDAVRAVCSSVLGCVFWQAWDECVLLELGARVARCNGPPGGAWWRVESDDGQPLSGAARTVDGLTLALRRWAGDPPKPDDQRARRIHSEHRAELSRTGAAR